MSVGSDFDGISRGYTGKMMRWLPDYRSMLNSLVDVLPGDFRAQKVLDLGCGNGNATALLIERFPDAEYTLVDVSEEMIKIGRERFSAKPNIHFVQEWLQALSFPASRFDLVVAGLSLHHLEGEEKARLFEKIHRWLEKGGCFICTDLFVEKTDEPLHSEVLQTWRKAAFDKGTTKEEWDWIMDHYDQYDRPSGYDNQIRWLKDAGFEEVEFPWRDSAWATFLVRK